MERPVILAIAAQAGGIFRVEGLAVLSVGVVGCEPLGVLVMPHGEGAPAAAPGSAFAAWSSDRDFSPCYLLPRHCPSCLSPASSCLPPSLCPAGQPATVTCQAVVCPAHQLPWGTRES